MSKDKKQKVVAINLIAFSDNKAVGSLVHTRRLLSQLWLLVANGENLKLIVYIQRHLNIVDFGLPNDSCIEIIRVPSLRSATKRIIFEQTLFYFYTKRCDVFFTPTLSLPLLTRGKRLFTLYDMVPFAVQGKYSRFRLAYIKAVTRLYAKVSDKIITISQSSKRDILRFLPIKPSKIEIITCSIPYDEPLVNRNTDTAVLGDLDIKKPYFLTVATLQPAKNVDGLIRAFAIFLKDHPDYYLYIVGNKGWGYQPLFELSRQLDVEHRVVFTGYMSDEQLSVLYEECFGVAYFSFYEGFGLPPLEGFYHGKACVASDVSSIPEVVGAAGILVDPHSDQAMADGLERFLIKKSELEGHIAAQIEKFNPHSIARQFMQLLESI